MYHYATKTEKALLHIFYGCGLRRSEGVALSVKDLDFASMVLYVRIGKNQKRRVVPMSSQIVTDLRNYINQERKHEKGALLLNKSKQALTGNTANKYLKQLLERVGIDKQISLHSLRHSIATHLLDNGVSIEEVRDFLGHRYLEATAIYTRLD